MICKLNIILFIASGIITVLCGALFFDIYTRRELFRATSYYFIFAAFFIWLTIVMGDAAYKKERIVNFIRENFWGICVSAVIIVIFAIAVGGHFRLLADETNVVGVSKSIFLNKTAENSIQGFWYYNGYHTLTNVIDKRPILFPFLISLVHTVRGYSAYNGFILNFIISFLYLLNIYLLAKTLFSKRVGVAAILMTASYPIFIYSSTSSALETINLLFIIIALRYFYDYLCNQQAFKLNKLFVTLVLLSQCRYEAIGISLILMTAVLWIEAKNGFKNIQPFIVLIPLLYLPVIWQRSVTPIAAYMESAFKPGLPMFGVRYIFPNILEFLKVFFYPINNQYSACIISYIGVAGIVYGCMAFFRNIKFISSHVRLLMLMCLLVVLYYFGVIMSDYYGRYISTFYGNRLALVFIPFFALSAAFLINSLLTSKAYSFLIASLLAIFLFFLSVAIKDVPGHAFITGRAYILYLDFLKSYAGDSNILVITDKPNLITVHNIGAANFEYANRHKKDLILRLDRHLVTKVIIIQNISYDTLKPTKETELDPEYKLKTVLEIQNEAASFLRFSEYGPKGES